MCKIEELNILPPELNNVCNMCQEETEFCNAHIIPKSLKKLLNPNSKDNSFFAITQNGDAVKVQNIEWDKNILCSNCDNKLGIFDAILIKTVKKYLCHPERNLYDITKKNQVIELDVNTQMLKLSLVTILYRSSLSNRIPDVDLGKKYSNIFRKWLISGGIPLQEKKFFEIVAIASHKDKKNIDNTLSPFPKSFRYQGMYIYMINIFGMILIMKVGNKCWNSGIGLYPRLDNYPDKIKLSLQDFRQTPFYDEIVESIKNNKSKSTE